MATLLITGTTGFVGQHVLAAALASAAFGKVFSVTRRPLPTESPHKGNAKLQEIILKEDQEWLEWPPTVIKQIGRVDACVWAQGVVPSKGSDTAYVLKVSLDYTTAGIRAILAGREQAKADSETPLRFIYLTGALTERDPEAKLLIFGEMRKARGAGEVAMLDLQREVGRTKLRVTIAKCGSILRENPSWMASIRATALGSVIGLPMVPITSLVNTLLAVATKGSNKSDLSNDDLCSGSI